MKARARRAWILAACVSLPAQADNLFFYLVKQGLQQGNMILRSQSIGDILTQPNLNPETERNLRLSQEVLSYAESHVGMKIGKSYRRYVDLHRPWVTQIVMAAEKQKLQPHLFQYPVVGSLPYQGFFDEDDARALEKQLQGQGLDTYRRPVTAFSSLGWLPDPLLSTMLGNEAQLIETLFHELTHLNFYFKGDADFNEAFASWLGYRVALEFLQSGPQQVTDALALRERLTNAYNFQIHLADFVKKIIRRGHETYASSSPADTNAGEKRRAQYFAWIRTTLKADPTLQRLSKVEWNNAYILSLGTYYELVPQIEAYAQTHKLNPSAFLKHVIEVGPGIAATIRTSHP